MLSACHIQTSQQRRRHPTITEKQWRGKNVYNSYWGALCPIHCSICNNIVYNTIMRFIFQLVKPLHEILSERPSLRSNRMRKKNRNSDRMCLCGVDELLYCFNYHHATTVHVGHNNSCQSVYRALCVRYVCNDRAVGEKKAALHGKSEKKNRNKTNRMEWKIKSISRTHFLVTCIGRQTITHVYDHFGRIVVTSGRTNTLLLSVLASSKVVLVSEMNIACGSGVYVWPLL